MIIASRPYLDFKINLLSTFMICSVYIQWILKSSYWWRSWRKGIVKSVCAIRKPWTEFLSTAPFALCGRSSEKHPKSYHHRAPKDTLLPIRKYFVKILYHLNMLFPHWEGDCGSEGSRNANWMFWQLHCKKFLGGEGRKQNLITKAGWVPWVPCSNNCLQWQMVSFKFFQRWQSTTFKTCRSIYIRN